MKKRSIVFKLFLLTSALFTATFLLFFLGQSLFLEKFYIKKKIHTVQTSFEKFVSKYEKSDQSVEELSKLKQEFYEKTNAELVLLDRNGIIQDDKNYHIELVDKSNKTFFIPLNNIFTNDEYSSFIKLGLNLNDPIRVQGILKQDMIIPITITTADNRIWQNDNIISDLKQFGIQLQDVKKTLYTKDFGVGVSTFDGTISKLHIPSSSDIRLANKDTLIQGIQHWELSVALGKTNTNEMTTYTMGGENEVKYQIFVKPVVKNGEIKEFAFAMTSLQPVDEAMLVLKDYYVYALIIVFIVIILLSFYYSKIIAKPLIKMNRVTKKMANFDFSEKLPISTDDEIGSLSGSINSLSVNLKDRIDKLHVANTKLQQDIEKERQLEKTRKEFISGVSHELKTPLSVIRSFAEGIKDGVSKDTTYYTDVILEETDNMNRLIVEMLELAKLESGTYKLEIEAFSIGELIQQVYTKLLFSIEEKNLHVELALNPTIYVQANRNRIEQVVVNLLSNAIRYTPNGKQVKLSVIEYEEMVKVEIENNGTPIPEESLDKIWDRFYRLDASRSRHTGGTGLGLSIVKNILELHHADYGVYNKENGVAFYFELQKAKEVK
ncbi:HAMP domain-containing histidine kinase [Bacillus sp. 3103sda1]|uniref:HAMP domain-containing sensor histidine kinase n=1 Tax=Bacillus sp. 3103sda1 TaxID=2953808 RepID=UPI0020A0FC2D|nr:HAMP domain-containing sensor histidine kinase [Bacillus sp. 3103sda1]MCP1123123.1 HAMP domain-containing histidine kinase [Bacillus sp. 3103sda1]